MCKDSAHLKDVKAAFIAGFRIQFYTGTRWYTSDGESRWSFEEKPENYRVHPDDMCKWIQYKMDNYSSAPSTTKPHVHAELIKAWADGTLIQYKVRDEEWTDTDKPSWHPFVKYRIKPEQTDLEKYGVEVGDLWHTHKDQTLTVRSRLSCGVITLSSGVCVDNVHLKTLLFRRGVVNKL